MRHFRAISLKQPWANLIVEGRKTIETRTWSTPYRGELLIVSSKRPPIPPAGSAVAIATLVDCRPMTRADEPAACCELYQRARAFVLEDVRPIRPFAVLGFQRIYLVDVEEHLIIEEPLALQPLPGQLSLFAP